MDTKDFMSGIHTRESFACGFRLAWQLFSELQYDNGHSLEETLDGTDRFFMPEEKQNG